MKAVQLPNGKSVTLSAYVKAWRVVRDCDPSKVFNGWGHFPTEARKIRADMLAGMHDRINWHMAPPPETCDDDTFWRLRRLANTLNGSRVVVGLSEIPERYRARLAHRVREAA